MLHGFPGPDDGDSALASFRCNPKREGPARGIAHELSLTLNSPYFRILAEELPDLRSAIP
jgi:hypothetical protein